MLTYTTSYCTGKLKTWDIPTGQLMANSTQEFGYQVSMSYTKNAVLTGFFKPGIYRVNPYTVGRESYESTGVKTWVDKAIWGSTRYEATMIGDQSEHGVQALRNRLPPITSSIGNYSERALVKAYGKLGAADVNLGECIGEYRETLNLLRHPFLELRKFLSSSNYRNLGLWQSLTHYSLSGKWVERGGRVITGKRAAKVAADTWLEFRYGFMPLVYTVMDIMEMVDKKKGVLFNPNLIRKAVANVKAETSIPFLTDTLTYGTSYTNMRLSSTGTDKMNFHASVQYKLTAPPALLKRLSLTGEFLPEVAWELTRLSFVVDWWYGIGPWLATLRFTPEIVVLGNTVSYKIDRNVSVKCDTNVGNFASNYAPYTIRGEIVKYRYQYFCRRVNLSLPLFPLLQLEFRSVKHAIDAAALILQPLLSGKRR